LTRSTNKGFHRPTLVGTHVDQEFNRDVNYVRFINPSDYRVAQISCGSASPASTSGVSCHGTIVDTIRKSIMATNQGQFATATYANHSPFGATNMNPLGTNPTGRADPRDGEQTITFNYDDIDAAYNPATNSFDGDKLRRIARNNSDPFDDDFEATGVPLVDKDGQQVTAVHDSSTLPPFAPTNRLRGIGGKRIIAQALPRAQKTILPWTRRDSLFNPDDPTSSLLKTVLNLFGFTGIEAHHPVDAGFNAVRAFDPGLFPDVNQNFATPFDNNNLTALNESRRTDIAAGNLEFVPPNPFNRNRNSGCASCHMLYRADGLNEEPFDKTVKENGHNPSTGTLKGMEEDKGERGYPAIHQLTTKIPTDQCGICHVFTTRVDVAFKGMFEVENNNFQFRFSSTADANKKNIPLQFTNNRGTRVNIFDNFATVDKDGNVKKDTNGLGGGESVTEDLNNNGVLDPGEDKNGNQRLDVPDRIERADAQDGRQMRFATAGRPEPCACRTFISRRDGVHRLPLSSGPARRRQYLHQQLGRDRDECQDCHGTAKSSRR
jgi:hypothetical protein